MTELIYAHTQAGPSYPGYVNLTEKCEVPLLTVRSPGKNGTEVACLPIMPKQLLELADAIIAKYRP